MVKQKVFCIFAAKTYVNVRLTSALTNVICKAMSETIRGTRTRLKYTEPPPPHIPFTCFKISDDI